MGFPVKVAYADCPGCGRIEASSVGADGRCGRCGRLLVAATCFSCGQLIEPPGLRRRRCPRCKVFVSEKAGPASRLGIWPRAEPAATSPCFRCGLGLPTRDLAL